MVILLIIFGVIGGAAMLVMKKRKAIMEGPTPIISPAFSPSVSVEVSSDEKPAVKEFTMTSWYEMKDGKATTNFSLNEIGVKKGDTVRIKVINTKGNHDFSLDEYGIKKLTPLNQEVTIEFTADKTGSFKYYCSMPGHRMMGQEGTLTVQE